MRKSVMNQLERCRFDRVALACALVLALLLAACASGTPQEATDAPATSPSASSTSTEEKAPATRHVSEAAKLRARSYEGAWESRAVEIDDEDTRLELLQEVQPKTDRYTVMVYMIGSNLESTNASATSDLQEMADSGIDLTKTNVVVYAGGCRRWNIGLSANRNSILDLSLPEDDRVVAQTDTAASMGSPKTLSSFIHFCEEYYPSEHYALVFWDHGGGPLWGYGYDEANKGDSLMLQELKEAMDDTSFGAKDGKKLDWVGFDACLMGSLENASLWRDYANLMIASEETEPGDGWDYGFLATLNSTDDAATIAEDVLEHYHTYYEAHVTAFSNPDTTLAALDLTKTKEVGKRLDALLALLTDGVGEGSYAQINRMRRSAKSFGAAATASRAEGYDLVDLYDFAEKLTELYPDEAKSLTQALDKLVLNHVGNVERAHGISLYVPVDNQELYTSFELFSERQGAERSQPSDEAASLEASGLTLSDAHERFLATYTDQWLSAAEVDWNFAPVASDKDGLTLKLTPEQAENVSTVSYTVMEGDKAGTYFILTSEVEVDLDADGTIHVPADPPVLATKTDISSPAPGWFNQVEVSGKQASYVNNNVYLLPAGELSDFDSTAQRVSVTLNVTEKDSGDYDVSIASVSAQDESIGVGGKNTIDVSEYSSLAQFYYTGGSVHPTFDENGALLPWDEWDGGGYMYRLLQLESGLSFTAEPISHFEDKAFCQIVVTDINGIRHALDPVQLPYQQQESTESYETTVKTELGTLTFEVWDDHADVKKYEGNDWHVDIPQEVDGRPVVAIGEGAFSSCRYLDEMVLPEGIETIGAQAFSYSGVYRIVLPTTLKHIVSGAFAKMEYLQGFELAGKNGLVSVKDGVLFTADGSTLLAYPNAKGDTYEVPEGVRTIGYAAFTGTGITEVHLPEGLRVIDRAAFFDCNALSSIEMPASLERIGALAFGSLLGDHAPVTEMVLGPRVEHIGAEAFGGLNLRSIVVDEANSHYSSANGLLLSAAGDQVIELPMGTDVIQIPETVTKLGADALTTAARDTVFIVPDSVTSCDERAFPYSYVTDEETGERRIEYNCEIHASEGSYAQTFAEQMGIAYSSETDYEKLAHEYVVENQEGLDLTYWVFADHAELRGMSTSDSLSLSELVIPGEIAGKPVTVVAPTTSLDDGWCTIRTLVLPATLKSYNSTDVCLRNVRSFALEEGNEAFSVEDGVLFSQDGTVLVSYPADRPGASYEVPDGVEEIASHAFIGADKLKDIVLPESLELIGESAFEDAGLTSLNIPDNVTSIGERAFHSCYKLTSVSFGQGIEEVGSYAFDYCSALVLDAPLPDSLEVIGDYAFNDVASYNTALLPYGVTSIGNQAFGETKGTDSEEGQQSEADDEASTLYIGPFVEKIGSMAFTGVRATGFELDEDNEAFRVEGPFLLTADGRTLVAFANGYEGEAEIPDGVRTITADVFAHASGLKKLSIPDSVLYIERSWLYDEELLASTEVHVHEGSYAARYAKENELSWVVE